MAHGPQITVTLIDPDGVPVAGALVGLHLGCHLNTGTRHWLSSYEQKDRGPAKTDEAGRVSFYESDLFAPGDTSTTVALYGLHAYRRLAGLMTVTRSQLGGEVQMKLKRACALQGSFASPQLEQIGRSEYWWNNVFVEWSGFRPLSFATTTHTYEFLLPPGKYKLKAYGRDVQDVEHTVKISADAREMEVNFQLPVTPLAKRFGKPAPELPEMKAWQYGQPVTLESLRNEIVLLSFFNTMEGEAGIKLIPALMELFQTYITHGLKVIAVHDACLKTPAKFSERMNELQARYWQNHAPPFPICLDSGSRKRMGSIFSWKYVGAAAELYGIRKWPTTILIDRDGTVLREIYPQVPLMQFELGRLLGVEAMLAVEPA